MPTLLFVCTANICRSPMAAALMARLLEEHNLAGEWKITSTGTWAAEGMPASSLGLEVLRLVGLDGSAHRSRCITGEMLAAADLALTMEKGHKEALIAEFSSQASRIFMLSEMTGLQQDIADPYGSTLVDYQDTLAEIDHYLRAGLTRILQIASTPPAA